MSPTVPTQRPVGVSLVRTEEGGEVLQVAEVAMPTMLGSLVAWVFGSWVVSRGRFGGGCRLLLDPMGLREGEGGRRVLWTALSGVEAVADGVRLVRYDGESELIDLRHQRGHLVAWVAEHLEGWRVRQSRGTPADVPEALRGLVGDRD